jgi:hypothetical protein
MSTSKKNILKVTIDNSIKTQDDLFVKLLSANKEFVRFMKTYSIEDLEELNNQLKKVDFSKTRSKTRSKARTTMKMSQNKTRSASIMKGGISRATLASYINAAIYFIYCATIVYGLYQGSDMVMSGINQVRNGTCNDWTNHLTGAIGLGTRHGFCDIWSNITHTLLRAFGHGDPYAIGYMAVSAVVPYAAILIQMRTIHGLSELITDRVLGIQQGQIQYPAGPIYPQSAQVYQLPPPTQAMLPSNAPAPAPTPATVYMTESISDDEDDSRMHPSRRNNLSRRRSRSRSRSRGGKKRRHNKSRKHRA